MATKKSADPEADLLAMIAGWPEPWAAIGERIHRVVVETAPELNPKLFCGAPGYTKGGPVHIFLRLDDGNMSFGLTENANVSVADDATEKRIAEIVRRAAG